MEAFPHNYHSGNNNNIGQNPTRPYFDHFDDYNNDDYIFGDAAPAMDTLLAAVRGFRAVAHMLEAAYSTIDACMRAAAGVAAAATAARERLPHILSAMPAIRLGKHLIKFY